MKAKAAKTPLSSKLIEKMVRQQRRDGKKFIKRLQRMADNETKRDVRVGETLSIIKPPRFCVDKK